MRQFIVLSLIILGLTNISFAEEYCACPVPKDLSCGFVRISTNCLGMNFAAKKIASKVIKNTLKKNFNGDFDVKVSSFSGPDLKRGKVKGVNIVGKNLERNGIYISDLNLDTLCDYNYVEYNRKPILFHTDVPLAFKATISDEDLNRTFIDLGFIQKLTDLNIYGISLFKVENVEFKLKNSKIYLITCLKAPLLMGERLIKITFSGKLNVEDGKIVLENLVAENLRSINLDKIIEKLNTENFFSIPINMISGTDSTLSVKNIKVLGNRLHIDGIIVIKRNVNGAQEEK